MNPGISALSRNSSLDSFARITPVDSGGAVSFGVVTSGNGRIRRRDNTVSHACVTSNDDEFMSFRKQHTSVARKVTSAMANNLTG